MRQSLSPKRIGSSQHIASRLAVLRGSDYRQMAQYNPPPPGYPPPTNPGYPPPPTNPAYNTPPQPYHPPQPYNPPQAYTPPPPTHHTIVVQQPVVVRQGPTVRSQSDDFLRGFGKALDSVATDVAKGASSVAKEASSAVSTNPLTLLRPGYIVQLVSKVCGKSLRVVENGAADCAGSGGTACQFEVLGTSQSSHIKLRNVANPKLYLAITGGYFIGYGQGGTDCDFVPAATLDKYVTFESLQTPGSHIGVLPSGQLTSPAQTTKATDASHFAVRYIRTALH